MHNGSLLYGLVKEKMDNGKASIPFDATGKGPCQRGWVIVLGSFAVMWQ